MVDMPQNPTKPNQIYLINMYKEDLALNNQRLVDMPQNPTKPNQIYLINMYKLNDYRKQAMHGCKL